MPAVVAISAASSKLAGWDSIMFFGKSPKPVYLLIRGRQD
jgi:aldehyde:ferredoxin oxidoreductase